MNVSTVPATPTAPSLRFNARPIVAAAAVALPVALFASPARAVDGCLVLLCFAAPNWSAIPGCVPPIRQVLDDLLHGHPFPTCGFAGAGNAAGNDWASAPRFCPPQYTTHVYRPQGDFYTCRYFGAVSVSIEGQLFTRTWWTMAGDTVTEFTPAAKARFGTWNTRFDDDYAMWLASRPSASAGNAGW